MSEQALLPAPEKPAVDNDTTAAGPPPVRTDRLPWFCGLGFLILAAAIIYVWQNPRAVSPALQAQLAADQQKLASLDSRLGRIEQQPAPPSAADLGKISARLDALEARISDQTQLSTRLDSLSGRIESLSAQNQSSLDATKQQLAAITSRLAGLDKTGAGIDAVAARVSRIARIQGAALALSVGQPLGSLPNAPPALARFETVPPPTEAQLRLTFPSIERAATAANQSSAISGPFLDQVLERAEDLVTVRRGDQVISGNSPVVALARARAAVDAGDLATAVAALSSAGPSIVRASADWVAQAKALLAAQSALADLAAHS
jgi:hypothetical protein